MSIKNEMKVINNDKRQRDSDSEEDIELGFVKRRNKKDELKLLSTYDSDSDLDTIVGSSDSELDTKSAEDSNGTSKKPNDEEDEESDMFASENEGGTDKGKKSNRSLNNNLFDIDQYTEDNLLNDDEIVDKRIDFLHETSTFTNIDDETEDVQIEPFNIDDDIKTGKFDKEGNYTQYKKLNNDNFQQDKWLDEFADIKTTQKPKIKLVSNRNSQKKRIQRQKRHYMVEEALLRLKYFISKNGTVISTLGDLNKLRKSQDNGEFRSYISNSINFVTDLIEILEQKSIKDVYNLTRNDISSLLKEEALSDKSLDDLNDKIWSFKWLKNMREVYEFYSTKEMGEWNYNYFVGNVLVKFKDDEDKIENWIHISCVHFT